MPNVKHTLDVDRVTGNEYSGMNFEEFASSYLMEPNVALESLSLPPSVVLLGQSADSDLPPEVDWRKLGKVSPIQQQSTCGKFNQGE